MTFHVRTLLKTFRTMSSVYCFVSGGGIHCVPVNSFKEYSDTTDILPAIKIDQQTSADENNDPLARVKIKHKNLLYALNNPSLSDLESDIDTNGDHEGGSEYLTGLIDNYRAHAVYLPDFYVNIPDTLNDNYTQIKQLLKKVFSKTWHDIDNIKVSRLRGGITNMLLKCTSDKDTVLMRVYGPGTNIIIDRHREFILHLVLNSMGLAPPVHARIKNGLIYGFLDGRSLEPHELRSPGLFPLIAQQLGNWHKKVQPESINAGVTKLREYTKAHKRKQLFDRVRDESVPKKERKHKRRSISDIWELLEDWIDVVPIIPELIESFQANIAGVTHDNIKHILHQEFVWLQNTLLESVSSPIISCHCDLLSGNIIIPNNLPDTLVDTLPNLSENPVKFIDYEYMLPAPRAFDIANHLAEWQGFNCDRSAIPDPTIHNPIMKKWIQAYLNNYHASDEDIKGLIDELKCYYGLPGFYWGIWAVIQSEISNIDFNYANYAKLRLQEYWDWKKTFINQP